MNEILMDAKIPDEWKLSSLIPLYKGKGNALECGNYRGIKLLEHPLKLFEHVLLERLKLVVGFDKRQYGFVPGRGTTDAIFVLRRISEEYRKKERQLYAVFVDLEKAYDRVPRRVVEWALRVEGVPEYLVMAVMATYSEARTAVVVDGELGEPFEVGVGVHQGSVLSPLLFVTVMRAVTTRLGEDSMRELLYADDIVLLGDCLDEVKRKYVAWKKTLESKGLRVNSQKTKWMRMCGVPVMRAARIDPCAVCGSRVMRNSIRCVECGLWVHKRCSGESGRLSAVVGFRCRRCKGELASWNPDSQAEGDHLEEVREFCYLVMSSVVTADARQR